MLQRLLLHFPIRCQKGNCTTSQLIHSPLIKALANLLQDKSILEALQKATPKLAHFAETGEMETTVVLLPESSRKSSLSTWWTRPTTLHRRQSSETVLSSNENPSASKPTAANTTSRPKKYVPPLCFISKDACMNKTNNCSDGQGKCEDAWATGDNKGRKWQKGDEKLPCFKCECKKTRSKSNKSTITSWAGPMCDKTDVSTSTNLFLGTALVLFGALALGFKMMYDVGYAPLPPILEAGVIAKK
ncbi:DUF3844 domain-containing protein [Candidatus Bathyarchaeota archaeon]|nr:DUF3844 domain-containing protein [Candidatus Bathyarchaeota archaeon]